LQEISPEKITRQKLTEINAVLKDQSERLAKLTLPDGNGLT
jgi:hypothetical protein